MRLSAMEEIVGKLVATHQAVNLEALRSIGERVSDLSRSVQRSEAILQELLPQYKVRQET